MTYETPYDAEFRKIQKQKKREANKKAWAERNKLLEAKLPIGYSASDDKKRMIEFKNQLLTTVNVTNVTRKVLAIALNDDHPGQMAALKMCLDRQLPVSLFEETKDTGRVAIQVNISGLDVNVEAKEIIENDKNEVQP